MNYRPVRRKKSRQPGTETVFDARAAADTGVSEQGQPRTWTTISAALPNLVLAALYALAAFWKITVPLIDRRWLGTMMGIEFLVIHSFPFMMIISSTTALGRRGRLCRSAAFWGLFLVYFAFAAKLGGLPGVAGFAGLTAATYMGYLLRLTSPDAVAQLAARWLMSFLVFVVSMMATGVPENVEDWPEQGNRVLYFGLLYFLVLGTVEATGFYDRPYIRSVIEYVHRQVEGNWRRKS